MPAQRLIFWFLIVASDERIGRTRSNRTNLGFEKKNRDLTETEKSPPRLETQKPQFGWGKILFSWTFESLNSLTDSKTVKTFRAMLVELRLDEGKFKLSTVYLVHVQPPTR